LIVLKVKKVEFGVFECGAERRVHYYLAFSVQFFILSLVFVLFDLESVFLLGLVFVHINSFYFFLGFVLFILCGLFFEVLLGCLR